MDVLPTDELDCVAGGFVPMAILTAMLLNLDKLTAAITGAIDGFRDGLADKPNDNAANPAF